MRIFGEGSIQAYDGKSRRYCRQWRIFFNTEAGTKTRVVHGNLHEANAAKRAFRAELEALDAGADMDATFKEYAEGWLDFRVRNREIKDGTAYKYGCNIRRLESVIDVKVSAIKPKDIKDALLKLRGMGFTGTYLNSVFNCLNQIMGAAVSDGLLTVNPCKGIKAPKPDTPEKRALSKSEMSELLDRMDALPLDGRVMAVYLMCLLGLRRGECLALTWDCVSKGVVSVRKTVVESSGNVDAPKSRAGVRRLPMPSRLKRKMKEWRKVCQSEYVCCDTKGGRLHAQNLRRWWLVNGADVTLHGLRHSNLTMMAGHMGAFDLSKWAGWSSVEPARVYVHDDLDRLTAAAKSVEL